MAQVALAAGFGSVRRFNETFQQLFRRPPISLRRGRQADHDEGDGAAVSVELPYRPPYHWEAMLAFLAARAIPGVEAVASGRYARTSQDPTAYAITGFQLSGARRSGPACAPAGVPLMAWHMTQEEWRKTSSPCRATESVGVCAVSCCAAYHAA